ncbi:MAG: Flp family type IVb pilin [Pseudolabrys sp.]|nr:Flp family type IVb pilin [Pseudolabrys sp.]
MKSKNSDRTLRAFVNDQSGATAIEYSLIAAGIAAAIIATVTSLGTSTNAMWQTISDAIN